jgi:acyl-CoA synthetase (AMP-forming)/AMP-acid ligase II
MPAVTISIRPEEGAPEGSGRVHVAGPAVSSGYAGQPSADLGFVDHGYLTGDFGRFRGDCLVLTGRASSFINVAGRKVLPDEVEAVVRQLDGVDAVSVIGADDRMRGQQVVACIVTRRADLNERVVRQHCASRLSAHKVPRTIVWLDRLPLTERGKLDRAALARLVQRALE